jgi:hypothetical protein
MRTLHVTRVAVLVLVSALVACGSVPLTPGGQRVKSIEADQAKTCKYITSEDINDSSFGAHPGICEMRARDSMRNRVAELGGNAYVQTHIRVYPCAMGGTSISFEAYRCPEP